MGRLAAIDPGKHFCGVALFREGILEWAGNLPSATVGAWVRDTLANGDAVIVETPQNYGNFAVAHADLATLREVLRRALSARKKGVRVRKVLPHAWKGNVPKTVHHNRVLLELTPVERRVTSGLDHNAMDAVALGLFGLGRHRRGGVAC